MPDRTLDDFMGIRPPRSAPTPKEVRRAERRRATALMPKCACGNVAGQGETQCGRCREIHEVNEIEVERGAAALLHHRGFGFYTDPEEAGQDAYDLSLQAMDEVRAVLRAVQDQ